MNEMVKIQHQQWARDLDDQRRSGLTQREWCRIHGISIHTFEYRCRMRLGAGSCVKILLPETEPQGFAGRGEQRDRPICRRNCA